MHPTVVRRLLYFLLVTLLINAGGWTFNREAMADVFFAEQETVPAGMGQQPSAQAGQYHGEPFKAKAPCNHWCHAVGHFLALFGQAPSLALKPITDYPPQLSRFIPEPARESLFRPPRLLS